MTDEQSIARNVSMYQSDWDIVQLVAQNKQTFFEGNISRALRYIVRNWARTQREAGQLSASTEHTTGETRLTTAETMLT
jgi:hypothetical protein